MTTEDYIEKFGGVKSLARFLCLGRSTVQEWRNKREMPASAKRTCDVIWLASLLTDRPIVELLEKLERLK